MMLIPALEHKFRILVAVSFPTLKSRKVSGMVKWNDVSVRKGSGQTGRRAGGGGGLPTIQTTSIPEGTTTSTATLNPKPLSHIRRVIRVSGAPSAFESFQSLITVGQTFINLKDYCMFSVEIAHNCIIFNGEASGEERRVQDEDG